MEPAAGSLSAVQIFTMPDPLLRILPSRSEISAKGTFELRDLFGPHLNRQPYPRRRPCATKLLKKM